ncbi:MAG TPA: CHAT domain-containing protein [Thermoanaerobaculia bacterium]|nr:CHAT domain-containing protein [Thermoanaerobaculia bacterium]
MARRRDRQVVRGPDSDFEPTEELPPVSKNERTKALRDLGSDPGSVARAAKILRQAGEQNPKDVRCQSDAAAALYAQAQAKQDPLPLLDAYAFAERSTKLDPSFPEARFNRALVEEALGLREQARGSWARYLALDPDSEWSAEAQAHLDRLAPAESEEASWRRERVELERAALVGDLKKIVGIVDRHRQAVREEVLERTLPEWSKALLAGDPSAAQHLNMARLIGSTLEREGGDRELVLLLKRIDAEKQQSPILDYAQSLAAISKAQAKIRNRDFEGAASAVNEASISLIAVGPPLSLEADLVLLRQTFQANRYEEAIVRGRSLASECRESGLSHLRGRALWITGTAAFVLGRRAEGDAAYRDAAAEFLQAGEIGNLTAVQDRRASGLRDWSEEEDVWTLRLPLIRFLGALGEKRNYRLALTEAAFDAAENGAFIPARAFINEALRIGRSTNNAMATGRALLHRIEIGEQDHETSSSIAADLREARRWCARIPEIVDRRDLETDLLFASARLARRRGDYLNAIAGLNEVVDRYKATSYRSLLPLVLAERSAARLGAGDDREAEADLIKAIERLEQERSGVGDVERMIGFADRVRDIPLAMVALQLDHRHRPDLALVYAERGRAIALLDISSQERGTEEPEETRLLSRKRMINLVAFRASLAPNTTIAFYESLPERLLVWRISRNGITSSQIHILRSQLSDKIRRAIHSVQFEPGASKAQLAELWEILVRPLAPRFGRGTFVIVPCGELFAVPFAALFDRATGRYLVEEVPVEIAPSLRLYVARSSRANSKDTRALVVADPAVDRELFPTLTRLRSAMDEVEAVRESFLATEVLSDREATSSAVLAQLFKTQVVHFAVHARVNAKRPFLSELVLAPSSDGSNRGVITARELTYQPMPELNLVVLAACASAGTHYSASEGIVGLAWPFLAHGVHSVIASTWDVSDGESSQLFSNFYAALGKGERPTEALRTAQMLEIETQRTTRMGETFGWAAFASYSGFQGGAN